MARNSIQNTDSTIEHSCVVNSINSLWVCHNAMNPKHGYVFVCAIAVIILKKKHNEQGEHTTRERRKKMNLLIAYIFVKLESKN